MLPSLTQEIAVQQQHLLTYSALEDHLKILESQTSLCTNDSANVLAECDKISDAIMELDQTTQHLRAQLNAPPKLLQHSKVDLTKLHSRIAMLKNSNQNVRKKALDDKMIATIVPELEVLTSSVQSKFGELEVMPPVTLEQQESTLKQLQADKQNIQTLIENIPEGGEKKGLIRKSQWELSRLSEYIKRLGVTVDEKVSALTAFHATKSEIESQLTDLNRQMDMQHTKDLPLSASMDHLNSLKQQAANIERLQLKLCEETVAKSLDKEQNDEFEKLRQEIELMADKIQCAQNEAERQTNMKQAADLLKDKLNCANTSLVSLITQAQQLLNDAAAIPQSYITLANLISNAVEEASALATEDPSANTLQSNITEAVDVQDKLNNRWQIWLQFINERNLANSQLDKAHKAIQKAENKALRSLDDAQQDLADLLVSCGLCIVNKN